VKKETTREPVFFQRTRCQQQSNILILMLIQTYQSEEKHNQQLTTIAVTSPQSLKSQ
jgi:hypothetical protein